MKKYQFKEFNGAILRILMQSGLERTSDNLISELLKDLHMKSVLPNVKDHLIYLSGKGKEYIEIEEVTQQGVQRIMVRLTPRGIDLLFGVIKEDPGVSIAPQEFF